MAERALAELFTSTIAALTQDGAMEARKLFRPGSQINAAVLDAVMVGLARRLAANPQHPAGQDVRAAYDGLLADVGFQAAYGRATADEASVGSRLRLATEAFAPLP